MFIIISNLKDLETKYKENYILISNYTLHLNEASFDSKNINGEFNQLLKHFSKVLKLEAENEGYTNIKEMKDNKYIKKNNFEDASQKLDKYWIEKNIVYDLNYSYINSNKLNDIKYLNNLKVKKKRLGVKILNNNSESNIKDNGILEKKQQNLSKKITELEKKIELSYYLLTNIDDIFITFRNQIFAHLIKSAYNKSKFTRCCYFICCRGNKIKHLYFKNRWLNITETKDEPSNINWNNLAYNKCLRTLRVIFSFIIAILLIISTFGVIIASKYIIMEVTKDYNPDIDCSYISQSDYRDQKKIFDEFNDVNIKNGTKYLTYCYCLDKLINEGPLYISTTEIKINSNSILPCQSWFESFIKYNSVNLAVVIVIPIVNSIVVIILRLFASFEKNRTVTEEITSVIRKIFTLQLINSGIVIVIVNIKIDIIKNWNSSFPLFTGRYSDLDPAWYANVGVTIVIWLF